MVAKKNTKDDHYKAMALYYKNSARMYSCVAAVHVEASIDEIYWKKIFNHFLPDKKFYFISYSKTKEDNKATGSSICLKYKKLGCLSEDFLVCIDSDYRYLMQEKGININNYVFQTYTYSIENHWCFSKRINRIFEQSGLQNTLFDFEKFLKDYSETLYELFLYHLYSLSIRDDFFTIQEFVSFLNISRRSIDSKEILCKLREKIQPKLLEVKNYYSEISINTLEQEYYNLGLTKENAYLYFRGHNIFEKVVLPIANVIKEKLQEEQYTKRLSAKEKQAYYNKKKEENFTSFFYENLYLENYPEINKIEKDIENYFKK